MTQIRSEKQKEILRQKLITFARAYIGAPYTYGAAVKNHPRAFDCSSFVQHIYAYIGYQIPRSTIEQATFIKKTVPTTKDIKPGDLIYLHGSRGYYTRKFPTGIGHVIMYIGKDTVIHASGSGRKQGVVVEKLSAVIKSRKPLVVIKRII